MTRRRKGDQFPCTAEVRWCAGRDDAICEQTATELEALGVSCTGEYADEAKAAGRCGMPDAFASEVTSSLLAAACARRPFSVPVSNCVSIGQEVAAVVLQRGLSPTEATFA